MKQKGFTLIELLIVIAILGVLAAGVVVAINPAKRLAQARNAQRKMDISQIASALEAYAALHNGQYPRTDSFPSFWCGATTSYWNCGDDYIPGLVADGGLKVLPRDPRSQESFAPCVSGPSTTYLYASNGADYKIMAHCGLEGGVALDPTDAFYDPVRPHYSIMMSSAGARNW